MEMAFVNLPVRDLASATRSDEAIGFRRSPRVSGERASSVTCSDSSRSMDQIGRLPQPIPSRINASFVALSETRHVTGDSTPKSRPSVSVDGSSATIWI